MDETRDVGKGDTGALIGRSDCLLGNPGEGLVCVWEKEDRNWFRTGEEGRS